MLMGSGETKGLLGDPPDPRSHEKRLIWSSFAELYAAWSQCTLGFRSWWRRNVSTSACCLNHGESHLFYTCQYNAPLLFVVFRLVISAYAVHVLVFILYCPHHHKVSIYLTNWTYALQAVTYILEFVIAVVHLPQVRRGMAATDPGPLKWYLKLEWVLHNVTTVTPLAVSTLYWAILYHAHGVFEFCGLYLTIQTHACNSGLAMINFFLSAIPFRLVHFVHVVAYGLVYLLFSAVYYVSGGTSATGQRYIYPFLDWQKPGMTVATSVGIYAILFVVHTILTGTKSLQAKAASVRASFVLRPVEANDSAWSSSEGLDNFSYKGDSEVQQQHRVVVYQTFDHV